jgi:adenylate cyclase class 1
MARLAPETTADLRAFLRSGQENAVKVLPDLLARAVEDAAARPEASGRLAFLLAAILRGQRDMQLMQRTLAALLGMGRLGRALGGGQLQARILPLPQLTPLVSALPGRDFLAFLNEMLLEASGANGAAADKQFTAWLKGLLPAPGRLDIREALAFLKTLHDDGLPLARPLRDALLAAGLAETMSQAFSGSPAAASAEALLAASDALASPAVQAEALGYALRVAGSDGPSRLGPLLAAPPDLEPREAALIAEMRRLALLPDAPQQLLSAAQTEPEMLGLVLAAIIKNGGSAAALALRLTPLLPRLGVESCLADLAAQAGAAQAGAMQAVHAQFLLALAGQEPEYLQRVARGLKLGREPAQALATLIKSQPAPAPFAAVFELSPAGPAAAAKTTRKQSFSDALRDALTPIKDQDFSHTAMSDETIDGATLSGVALSHSRFTGVTFRRVRLTGAQLDSCAFERCAFSGCTFGGVDFSSSVFSACRLDSCAFEACDLDAAQLKDSIVTGCALHESNLSGLDLAKSRLDSLSLRTCAAPGLRAHESVLSRSTLWRCDLSAGLWTRSLWREAEFTACTLAASRLAGCEAAGAVFTRCGLTGLEVMGGHTDNPHLFQARRATRARCLGMACVNGQSADALPPELSTGPGAGFVRAAVSHFLRVDGARLSLAAMRAQNQRRRELALERLTEAQGTYLRLLPLILATDVFEKAQNIAGVPACLLAERSLEGGLGREALALLERHFPGVAPGKGATPQLCIEAVYAIGSLGSVAQRPASDIDCWLCYSEMEGAAEGARPALMRKLAALEAWTMQTFGLETHFFAMPMDEVRQNLFGMSDKESSGSAQAALLKEEFYRTAHRLAGRDLLWWAAPPSATQAEADSLMAELRALTPRVAAELVDLGQPMPIPPGEYFGACLWQIVKALHSPYKSVMKLALLEKYAGQDPNKRLLCDRIKEAALRGRKKPEEVDPYLSLFSAIRRHYTQLDDAGSLSLMAECLRLKADVDPEDLPAGFLAEEAALDGSFTASLRLGGMVNQFMISAYRRIQQGIRADRNAAQITPEDLTRLGRRIAANFAQHEHKVGLVPFLSEDIAFAELFFYAEKAPGKRTIWAVKGKEKDAGKATVESLAPIRRDTDVARLITWLVFNGIYDTRLAVQAEKSLAPIAVLDLQNLLADMAAFFPRRATLEPDLDEYLKPERVARAYIILNLPVPPDKNKVLTASVIYATNWGEVYCQTFDNPSPVILKSPMGFLRESLAKPLPQNVDLKAFTPKKSACPRLRIA